MLLNRRHLIVRGGRVGLQRCGLLRALKRTGWVVVVHAIFISVLREIVFFCNLFRLFTTLIALDLIEDTLGSLGLLLQGGDSARARISL